MSSEDLTTEDRAAPPRDNLYRAMPGGVTSSDGRTLTIRLAPAEQWAEIDSIHEGHFMERFARSAYTKTMTDRLPKILFQHGKDPTVGQQPIATTTDAGEDEISPYARGTLLDGVPELIVSGLREGVYGASHQFSVVREKYVRKGEPGFIGGLHNPHDLPERTVIEARLPEMGPVTWPAYATASAGLRSVTDEMRSPTPPVTESVAPSIDAEAETPHLESERRDEPVVVAAAIQHEERTVPTEYITREEKASRVTELKRSLADLAVEFPGVLPDDAQARWDADVKEQEALERDIVAWDTRQARIQANAENARFVEPAASPTYATPQVLRKTDLADVYDMSRYGPGQVRSLEDRDQKLRDGAMRSLDSGNFAHSNIDQSRAKEGVQDLLDHHDSRNKELAQRMLLTGSPEYHREFAASLVNMRPTQGLDRLTERAAALAVTGTTTTGGYMIPYHFDPTFIKTGAWTNINPFRQICRVEQIVGTNKWQGVSVGAVPAIYETEALAVTEAGPTFSNPSVQTQRASAFVSLSYETLQDRPNIVSELADLIQEGKDTLEEAQFSIGVGTTVYPLGMFVKSTFTVTTTITDNVFAVADLDATEAALPIRHRRDAVWMLSRGVIRIIQGWETAYGKLFNSTLGYPAVGSIENNPGGNTGLNLLTYPVWETPSAPVTVTTNDAIVGILVNPKNYIIVDRVGMNVELVPNLIDGNGKVTGQRGVFAMFRNSAKALNADAGRQINIQ